MMKNDGTFYKDKESHALTAIHSNDDEFQTRQSMKARYFKDDDYRSDKNHNYKVPHQVSSDKHISITTLAYLLFSSSFSFGT